MRGKEKKKRDKLNEENDQYIQKMETYLAGRINPFVYQDVIGEHREKLFKAQEQGLLWQDILEKDEEQYCKTLAASCTKMGRLEKGLKWIEEISIYGLSLLAVIYVLAFLKDDQVTICDHIYLVWKVKDMAEKIIFAGLIYLFHVLKEKMVFKEDDYDLVEMLLVVAFIVGGPCIIIFCIEPMCQESFRLNAVSIAAVLILLIFSTRKGRLTMAKRKYDKSEYKMKKVQKK